MCRRIQAGHVMCYKKNNFSSEENSKMTLVKSVCTCKRLYADLYFRPGKGVSACSLPHARTCKTYQHVPKTMMYCSGFQNSCGDIKFVLHRLFQRNSRSEAKFYYFDFRYKRHLWVTDTESGSDGPGTRVDWQIQKTGSKEARRKSGLAQRSRACN